MAETEAISKMADLASQRIFSNFGWEMHPLKNQNCPCVDQQKHRKVKGKKTHPTDVVFKYHHPYYGEDVYVNTDLKSYAKATLETTDLAKAIRSVAITVECANKSAEWKSKYVDQTRNHQVIGMLFVYNHDGGYDDDFSGRLERLPPSTFSMAPKDFVGIVGPKRVLYLNTIANDFKTLYDDGKLPEKAKRVFYFPHLNRVASTALRSPCAPLASLLSPLLIIGGQDHDAKPRYHCYYDGAGDSIDEFKYLLDYFVKYQLAEEDAEITVNLPYPGKLAAANFENAKTQFVQDYWPVAKKNQDEFKRIAARWVYRAIQDVVPRFDEVNLGMDLHD